jgi:hypothetical protein
MITDNFKLKTVFEPHFDGVAIKVRFFVLMLLSVIILLPSIVQADGLFDFQMKLAKKGNAEAQYKVGEMYETGFGVKQDMTEAENWISKANENGHETAGFKLLYWDMEKNGVTDANKAEIEALKTKANEGNGQAQYYIGKMYANGVGVKQNSNTAISWLNKAALVGVLEAEREMARVKENRQRWASEKQRADNKRRAEEKQRAEKKAREEREKLAKQEKQRKLQMKQQAEANKALAEEKSKQNKAKAEARAKADKEVAEKARALAQIEAKKRQQAEEKQREAQKLALLKKRAEDEKKRKTKFESDPCSGKSARFLSTCK